MRRLEPLTDAVILADRTEHPMFMPFDRGHLATVLTAPKADARGLVLLLQGLGAGRSHKNRVWTRTARGLAALGIASLRMDYPSMGDSTGTLRTGLDDLPVEEVQVAASLAMDLAGVDRMAIVGNCMGLPRTWQSLRARVCLHPGRGCLDLRRRYQSCAGRWVRTDASAPRILRQ